MAEVARTSVARWQGGVLDGNGEISAASGGHPSLPYSLRTRAGAPDGQSSPEELLAGAIAGCFAMALAAELGGRGVGSPAIEISVTAREGEVTDGYAVTGIAIDAKARATGLAAATLDDAMAAAVAGCPMLRAIRGNVPVTTAHRVVG